MLLVWYFLLSMLMEEVYLLEWLLQYLTRMTSCHGNFVFYLCDAKTNILDGFSWESKMIVADLFMKKHVHILNLMTLDMSNVLTFTG